MGGCWHAESTFRQMGIRVWSAHSLQVWQELSELLLFLLPLLDVTQLRRRLLMYLPRISGSSAAGEFLTKHRWMEYADHRASGHVLNIHEDCRESRCDGCRERGGGSGPQSQPGVRRVLISLNAAAVRRRTLRPPFLLLLPAQQH